MSGSGIDREVMDGDLGRLIAEQRGYFHRAQALDCGFTHREIESALRAGEWVRIRRGAFTTAVRWGSLDAAGKHVLTVRAVVGNLAGPVVVTGASALAMLGVPLWGVDLDTVHVARHPSRSARTDAHVVHHAVAVPDSQVVEADGLLVSCGERSLIDSARTLPFESGVVAGDGVMRLLPFDPGHAASILDSQRDWPGSLRAARVLRFSDGAAETVGESRSRVMIARLGLPSPQLQKCLHRNDGMLVARSDFYFEAFQTVGEFDGRQKYGRELYERTGGVVDRDLGEVVWQEKRREDAIRDAGHQVVRWVWSELDGHDAAMRRRFERAFERSGQAISSSRGARPSATA